MAAARTEITIHQMCQINQAGHDAKKAVTKPVALLCGTWMGSLAALTVQSFRFISQKASIVSTVGSTAKL